MLSQFLPSITRGVYRFNKQLSSYLQDDDAKGFVYTKKAFLPRHYLEALEKLINFSKDEADSLLNKYPNPGKVDKITANAFFNRYGYLAVENNNNYLERKFIQQVLTKVFNTNFFFRWSYYPTRRSQQ